MSADRDAGDKSVLGGLFTVLSAALFAFNNVSTRRGVLSGTTLQGMAITVPMGVVFFWIACFAAGSLGAVGAFSWWSIACFSLAGLSHFVFGRYFNYLAISAIGTNLASPIQQLELLVTLGLAVVFLGEKLTPIMLVGILLLLLGPALASRIEPQKAAPAATKSGKPSFKPRYAEGYACAFLTIFGYGASPIFIRAGLGDGGLQASLAAGLVSYVAATIVVVAAVLALGQVGHVMATDKTATRWFLLAGVLVFLSHMFRYMALALLPASIVSPIQRIQIIFRIYFAWLIARDYEVFDRNVILGTIVSMLGAILLSLQSELLTSWLPLPDAIKAYLARGWP